MLGIEKNFFATQKPDDKKLSSKKNFWSFDEKKIILRKYEPTEYLVTTSKIMENADYTWKDN